MATCLFAVLFIGATAGPVSKEYDVIVIGLGSAGTTAASTLACAGRRVLAIDALGCVGGWCRVIHGISSSRVYDAAVSTDVSTIEDKQGVLALFRSDGRLADDYIEHLVKAGYEILEEPKTDKPEPLSEYVTRRLMEYIREKKPEYANDTKLIQETLRLIDFWTDSLEASNSWTDVDASSNGEELDGYKFTSWYRHGYRTFFEILLNKYKDGPGLPSLEIKLDTEMTQIQSTWYSNPFTRGTYTYDSMQAASLSAPRATLAAPLHDASGRPRLLFAGEATHEKHFGTVHGASETGYREAERILAQTNQV